MLKDKHRLLIVIPIPFRACFPMTFAYACSYKIIIFQMRHLKSTQSSPIWLTFWKSRRSISPSCLVGKEPVSIFFGDTCFTFLKIKIIVKFHESMFQFLTSEEWSFSERFKKCWLFCKPVCMEFGRSEIFFTNINFLLSTESNFLNCSFFIFCSLFFAQRTNFPLPRFCFKTIFII